MNKMALDDSSDEDDPYTNFAGRLKALKEKRLKGEELSEIENFPIEIKQQKNEVGSVKKEESNGTEINGKETHGDDTQTQRRMVRRRRNKGITARAIRQTRGRQYTVPVPVPVPVPISVPIPVDDIEYEMEMVLAEESESIPKTCNNDIIALDDCSDDEVVIKDDNYEINIKVLWRSTRIDRLNICRHDTFEKIFQYYADLEKVSVNEILLMKKDQIINRTDTPASLKLSVIDILDGGIVDPGMNVLSEDKSNEANDSNDICTIKVQTANKKQSLTISLKMDQQFKALFANCAEQLGIKESSLKFFFDGEQINSTDTPESLDLEGEACIDLHISNML